MQGATLKKSRLFANEVIRGAQFLSAAHKRHIKQVTDERAAVVKQWIADGKMAPVDARHLFILLWSSTQYYADFEPLACLALGIRKLTIADYASAARTITQTVLAAIEPRE